MHLMTTNDTTHSMPQSNAVSMTADVLTYAVAVCPLGKVLIARSAKGVCAVLLGNDVEELTADLSGRFPRATLMANAAAVGVDMAKVLRYMSNPAEGLDLELDMRGTPFQQRVWQQLKAIAAGKTVSYTELAEQLTPRGNPRAVARACAANPIALAIPCHRVVRRSGALAGYRWGLERKRALLQMEAIA